LRIGWSNLKAYNHGVMKYHTLNINSIAQDGVPFTDHSAQPFWAAGRAAFITGQYLIRRMKPLGPGVAVYP